MVEILNEQEQERVFSRMASEIEQLDCKLLKVQDLVNEMTSCENGTFTADEVKLAQKYLEECATQAQIMRQNLADKIELYEKKILTMNRQLTARQSIIERFEIDGAIGEGGELFELLVRNHAQLSAELQEHTKRL